MNLPNKLTLLRVILIPFFLVMMYVDAIPLHFLWAMVIFAAASLTDMLDGKIARKYNLVTNFGKFMDPLADKLLVCSALICFVAIPSGPMPAWVVIVIMSREFIISGFRLVASDAGVVIAASYWGKIKTVVQMLMSILLIFNFEGSVINIVENVFIYAAVILTVISLIDYMVKNWNVMQDGNM